MILGNRQMDIGKENREFIHLSDYLHDNAEDGEIIPSYIFDSTVFDDGTLNLENYISVPSLFPLTDGLMSAIFSNVFRPEYRWFLLGKKNSGFGIHTDPFNTHAWNTLVFGKKRWALLPPSTSPDTALSCYATSAFEWFRERDKISNLLCPGMIEFIQTAGETIFIPEGWWHVAICIEMSVGITYNYLGDHSFREIIKKNLNQGGEAAAAARRWEEAAAAAV
jgi:hypothetical protein